AEFRRSVVPSLVNQIEHVANGDRDWQTLLFYLEGRDYPIQQLKEKWEKGWRDYEALEIDKERDKYREDNFKIEAQMFISGRFTTLSTEEARKEVLRIIEKENLNTELIKGYEKLFGVDTDKELATSRRQLGKVELDEEGNQKLKENGELDYFTTSNFATEVNKTVKLVGREKVEKDGNPLAIEYLRAKDSFVQYDSLTTDELRVLFRQQFPDVEASMYLWDRVSTFKNPKSAEILLGLMDKYNIPPESIPAFLDNPEKYDALFTQKFELEKKTFELDILYENYGLEGSPLYIPEEDFRKEAREKLKGENPEWMADTRRIEAIDHDASAEVIEAWAERGKTIDEFGAGSSEAKVWLVDNKDAWDWALGRKLLTDDGSGWNENVLRLDVEMAKLGEDSTQWQTLNYKKEAYTKGFSEGHINSYVKYYQELEAAGYRRERMLVEDPAFAREMQDLKGIEIPTQVPSEQYDILLEKADRTPEDERRMDAYKLFFPEELIDTYVDWYGDKDIKRPEGHEGDWYEDDWYLQEHPEFHQALVDSGQWTKLRDFKKVPTREVYELY
ncbi:hypothetical protein LCGC14_2341730, partial [marine sediment metagenome]